MSISGADLQLLNNICENGTYLEDNDDVQQQAGDILRDVSNWSEIEPEVQEKLFIACRQYLEISIEKQEILYDELDEKDKMIRDVQQESKISVDYGMNQGAHMIKQLEEQLDQERQDHEREKTELIAKIENDQREFESQLRDRDRSYDSLCKEIETLRMNQLKVGNDAANKDDLSRKLNEKRELLSEQIDANQKLEEVIRQLEEQNKTLRDDMEEATKQMIAMDAKYTKMEERYESDDVEHESLSNERDKLKSEVENLQQALGEREQETEQIRVEVVQRTNQLVAAAHEKDLEIARQSKQIDELDRQLRNAELAPEKRRLHEQEEELKQRALKISILEEKLNQSLNDVIELNEVIAKFNQQQTPSAELHHLTRRYESVVKEYDALKGDHADLEQRVQEQELTLRDVEDKLSKEVHIRSNLEAGVTGLPEARAENRKLEQTLTKRTKERDRLTMGIGEIDDKLTEMIDENDILRAQLEREQRDLTDISRLREQLNIRNKTMRSENETLRAKVEVLEEERIELKVRARRAMMNSLPENVSTASLTQAQLDQVTDLIDILRSGQQPVSLQPSEESNLQNKAIEDLTYGVQSELKALRGEIQSFTDARVLTSSAQLPVQLEENGSITVDGAQFSDLNARLILLQNELDSERRKYKELEATVKSGAAPEANEPRDLLTQSAVEAERRENVALQSTISDLLEKIKSLEETEAELQRDLEEKSLKWSKTEEEYETQCSALRANVDNLTTELQQCSVNLEEFTRLKNSLEGSADQKESQIADCIANLTNVRIELVRQKRAVRLAEHEVSSFKRKLARSEDILAALRKKNLKRIESVGNFRNEYKLQISRLRQELSSSVPRYQYEKIQLELEKKCIHIRKSAEMATNEVVAEIELSHLQDKFLKLQIEKDHVFKELTIAKEKLALLSDLENDENTPPVETIRSKYAALEIKELNERQKCAHLERRNEELEQVKSTLVTRIADLEKSLETLSSKAIAQADKEGELRTELSKSIPIDVADKTKALLQETVEENVSLNSETEKLRNLLALEESQTTQLRKELGQLSKSVELHEKRLKNTELLDSDSEATFLLLNKEINNLQAEVIESNNLKNQEAKKADKLEERVLTLEKDVNQRDILLSILIRESFQRTSVLEASVNEFKSSFAGAIPVESLERYQMQVAKIKNQKNELERHREALLTEKGDLESARVEYEVKLAGLNELMAKLKTTSSREKVIFHLNLPFLNLLLIKV